MGNHPERPKAPLKKKGVLGVAVATVACLMSGAGGAVWGAHLTNDAAAAQARAAAYADYLTAAQALSEEQQTVGLAAKDSCLRLALIRRVDATCTVPPRQVEDLRSAVRSADSAYYRLVMLGKPDVVDLATAARSNYAIVVDQTHPDRIAVSRWIARDVLKSRGVKLAPLDEPTTKASLIRAMTCDVGKRQFSLSADAFSKEESATVHDC